MEAVVNVQGLADWSLLRARAHRARGDTFSLSHFCRFLNWIPIMQAKVGPTRPPRRGDSDKPTVKIDLDI